MKYVVSTPTWGWKLKPERNWDGNNRDSKSKIKVISDSDFSACKSTGRSVTGYYVFTEDTTVTVNSYMHKMVALLVTEAQLMAVVLCLQDML